MWVAKTKIGLYKVQLDIDDIWINRSKCTCDARFTSYCEHSVAMLFALRKELGLKPILASTVPKIKMVDTRLYDLLRFFYLNEYIIPQSDINKFTRTAKYMLKDMEAAFTAQEYEKCASLGIAVITGMQEMDKYLRYNYAACTPCTDIAFEWLQKLYTAPLTEELQELIFHDVRIEAVRRYPTIVDGEHNWLDLMLMGATNATRQDQFIRTTNALCKLVAGLANNAATDFYTKRFIDYRDKLQVRI